MLAKNQKRLDARRESPTANIPTILRSYLREEGSRYPTLIESKARGRLTRRCDLANSGIFSLNNEM